MDSGSSTISAELSSHTSPITSCVLHQTNAVAVTGSDDALVKVWDVSGTSAVLAHVSGDS